MKRVISFILVLLMLICLTSAYAATSGTASDPLVSLSYLTDTYIPGVLEEAAASLSEKLDAVYDDASEKLEDLYSGFLLRTGGYSDYTLADSYTRISLPVGESVSMLTGGFFVLTSGTAAVNCTQGTVINISTGNEVPSGSSLTTYQRYFCTENTVAVFKASSTATCLVDGYYMSGGTVDDGINSISFSDVPYGTWYYDAVEYCVNVDLFKGMADGSFSPGTNMTMAQLLQVTYRMAGNPDSGGTYWYSAALDWSVQAGLINRSDFSANAYVTREYFIAMFYACADYIGSYDMTPRANLIQATDYDSVSSENREAISWAVATGIIIGTDENALTIDPDAYVNRAQVCQMIMRYLRGLD